MGDIIFEEIKEKYKKSNKYVLYVNYEDIGNLIQMVDILNKRLKINKDIKLNEKEINNKLEELK